MIRITAAAQSQLEDLEQHYTTRGRDLAVLRMVQAIDAAMFRIEAQIGPFFPAPRPYPDLADLGFRWLKEGRYWVAVVEVTDGFVVTGVFFETANLPGRSERPL